MAITKPFVAKHGLAIANTTHIVFNSDGTIHANNAGIIDSSSSVTNTAFQSALANTNLAIADRIQVANVIPTINSHLQGGVGVDYYSNGMISIGQEVYTNSGVTFANATISGLAYPTADGVNRQVIMTDGNGILSFESLDTIASEAVNQTGSDIPKGTPVYQVGTSGFSLEIAPADASDPTKMPAVGVTASIITSGGGTGLVLHLGQIKGVNTASFSEGDVVYVAPGSGYTNVKPTGEGNLIQNLGRVTKVDATNGGGVIMGAGRSNDIPNLNSGNFFLGNTSNQGESTDFDTAISNLDYAKTAYTAANSFVTSTYTTNTTFQAALANTNLAISDRVQVANLNTTLASYWPSANVIAHVATEVAALVNSAPSTLDTLQELAAALGNNENFATTLTTNLGQKLGATASVTLTGDATGSGSFSSNAVSIAVTVSDTFASNANLQTEVTRINLLNTNLTGTNTALRTLISDRMQVANVNVLVNDRMQVANVYALTNNNEAQLNAYVANTEPRLSTLESTTAANAYVSATYVTNTTFQSTLANTNAYIAYVAANAGEVSNAYLTSTFVTNSAFQAYVANTNARFTDHIANTSVANASFESTNNTITFTRQDSSVFDVVLTGITGSGGSANTEDISNQKFKTKQTGTEITYTVTVGTKTANSPWQAGSTSAYFIDGEEVPGLTLVPGFVYKFDQADATNASHPISFYRDAAKTTSYPTGVGSTGTPGSTGAYTTLTVTANTPMTLFYQCQNHSYMGGQIAVLSDTSPKYVEQSNVTTTLADYWPSANVINYIATNAGGVTNSAFNAYIANTNPRIDSLENNSVQLTTFVVNTLPASGGGSLTYNDTNGQFNFRPSAALPTVSNSAPTLSGNGALWFDEDDATLFIEYDGAWVEAAPVVGSSPNNFVSYAGNNTLRLITASGEYIDADLAQLGGGGGSVDGTTENLTGSSRVYTANGTATIFAAAYSRENPEDVFVTVDGVDQRPTTDYTVNGANVQFTSAPPSGTSIMIRTFVGLLGANTARFDINSYTANGTATDFFSPSNTAELNDLLITVNGVVQRPTTDYILSAQTVSFTSAPVNNSTVAIRAISSRIAAVTEQTVLQFANNTTIEPSVVDQDIKLATYTANGTGTTFAANTNSFTLNKSIVAVNGLLQRPVTDYTVSGNNVVFTSAPANNDIVSIREFNTAGLVVNRNIKVWEEVSSNSTLEVGKSYFADCSAGPLTLTLPASGLSMGDEIKIIDATGKSSNNNITVNSGGSKIMGDASDMTVSNNRAAFTLAYYNATQGWLLTEV